MKEISKAITYTLIASFFWGTSFVVIGFGLRLIDVYSFLFFRFIIAAVLAIIFIPLFGKSDFKYFKKPSIWLLGIMNGVAFALQYIGQTRTEAGRTALLLNINVITVAILSFWLFKEKFGYSKIIAVPVAVTGMLFLITGGDLSSINKGEMLGDVIIFIAGTIWAIYIVYTKKEMDRSKDDNPVAFLSAVLFITGLVTIFPMLFFGKMPPLDLNIWVIIFYMAIFCTFAAYFLWMKGLKNLSSTQSTIVLLMEPVVALVLSIWFLHEQFSYFGLFGALLILVSIILIAKE